MNPKISDTFAIEAAYSRGAIDYVANCSGPVASVCSGFLAFSRGSNFTFANNFVLLYGDAVLNPATGSVDLTEGWNIGARYRHFWTPYLRSVYGISYTVLNFTGPGAFNITPAGTAFGPPFNGTINSPLVGADFKFIDVTNELIWSPYTDLDLGIGVTWQRFDPSGAKEYQAWAGMFRAQWNW